MLFHVKHVHSWEACPYHDPDRARATFGKAMAGIMESEVELIGAYVDAAAHTTFLMLDATSASQIEEALAPVIDIGWAETRPVVDFADVMSRVTEDG
jgi:hypothetical protein